MKESQRLFTSGQFFVGCNYWVSHAGINMWHDWRPEIVEEDLKRLSEHHIPVIRMFPLWSDFQPLRMHRQASACEKELRLREDPLPFTTAGQAGIDEVMADRFEYFCDLAQKYGLHLIVGLITGWMSGRMYAPEAFEGRGLLSDPMVISWQIRFVKYMVARFKNHPAIAAWDLGNECNCMESVGHDQANLWVTVISDAIRSQDPDHPIVSGMHGLRPGGNYDPKEQSQALDILCTHPYPIFTPHCDTDPINEMKTVLHSTSETVMYESLGGIPAFIEEAGTLGPMISDEETAADYVRCGAFSAWAHDLKGFVWWCANEQSALTSTPYDWCSVERELGLFRLDGSPKPVVRALQEIGDFADAFPYEKMPRRLEDAVCILTEGQDSWGVAYGAFILAKQAGLDIRYAWCKDALPDANCYLLPSLTGTTAISRHALVELLSRVEQGATLYLSLNNALLSPFESLTGIRVHTRSRSTEADVVRFNDYTYHFENEFKLVLENQRATPLATDQEGKPYFTCADYGKGRIFFLAAPIELIAAEKAGVISGKTAQPLYAFYAALQIRNPEKIAAMNSPYVGLTEHPVSDDKRLLVLCNYVPRMQEVQLQIDGWEITNHWELPSAKVECVANSSAEHSMLQVSLGPNDGIVLEAHRK